MTTKSIYYIISLIYTLQLNMFYCLINILLIHFLDMDFVLDNEFFVILIPR